VSSLFSHSIRLPVLAALTVVTMLGVALSTNGGDAAARGVWCSGDPAIIVNGSVASVTVHVPLDRLDDVKQVEVVFHVPSNAGVTAVINDSVLIPAKVRYVKDLPPSFGLFRTPVDVEIIVHHKGRTMPVAATTIAVGWGSDLWTEGSSDKPLWVQTVGLLNLRIL
jgi:hypothetical protein